MSDLLIHQPTAVTQRLLEITGPMMGMIIPEGLNGQSEINKWGRLNSVISWHHQTDSTDMWRQIIIRVEPHPDQFRIKVMIAAWHIIPDGRGRLCNWRKEESGWLGISQSKAARLEEQKERDLIAGMIKPILKLAYTTLHGWDMGHLIEKTYLRSR